MPSDLLTSATVPTATSRAHRAHGCWRDRTHLDDLRDELARDPRRPLLLDHTRGVLRTLTVGDLAHEVQRLAEALRDRGVVAGEPVAYQVGNRWEAVAFLYACARLGAVAVPLPTSLGSAQVEQRVAGTGAVALVTTGDDATAAVVDARDRLPTVRLHVAIDAPGTDVDDLHDDVLPDAPAGDLAAPDPHELAPDAVALVVFTSGTTGSGKGVLHTANTLQASTRGLLGALLEGTDDARVLTPSVPTHVIGIMTSAISPVLHRHDAVLADNHDAGGVLELLRTDRPTHLLTGPRWFDDLLDLVGPDSTGPPSCLRVVALGGAALAAPVLRKADRLGVTVRVHWGMTECPGGGVSAPGDLDRSLHTLGRTVPGLERVLVREDGSRVEPGDDGEPVGQLWVRGAPVAIALFDAGDGSTVWTTEGADGWYATGDLAQYDDDGGLTFVDRDSDEIKGSSGMLIPTADVEDALNTHPAVSEVVLVGYHPTEQAEAPAAVVTPMPGASPTLDDLRRHLADLGMTEWYAPERLELVDRLPRDAQGKVDKRGLRARLDGS